MIENVKKVRGCFCEYEGGTLCPCLASTEEQAKHGISIDAQITALREWAKQNEHTIVDEYIDNGVSARKSPSKRPELQRLLQDIPSKDIAVVAFCKLDRWTRNIKGYYQVQDVLDKHKTAWIAIHEDYETLTASGRFKVNIMLSVAENEADRTSERIKAVLDYKVEKGEGITKSQPLGYKLENGKVVPSENAQAARDAFQTYADTGNVAYAQTMLREKYGIRLEWTAVSHLLRNPIYVGKYRDNANYCKPIISAELFNRVQSDLQRRGTRQTANSKPYLFSGLLVCAECGRRFYGATNGAYTAHRERYRCTGRKDFSCGNSTTVTEYEIEQHLVKSVSAALAGYEAEIRTKKASRPVKNKKAIESKIERLKELYIDGDISKEEYKAKKESLGALLKETPKPVPVARAMLGTDFESEYAKLNRDQKRTFWRSVLDHLVIDREKHIQIFFVP